MNIKQLLDKWWLFNYKQFHHLYTGIILIVIGIFLQSTISISLGTWLTLDDVGQHRLQKTHNDSNYHSYGHCIGKPLYHLRRWLVKKYKWEWLNKF